MTHVLALICIVLMVLALMLIFLGLPGTWVIVGLVGVWAGLFAPAGVFGWTFFLLLIGMAAIGEVVEFAAGYYGTRRFGGSNKGSLGGMIGAIVGGILCAPLFFGFGALLGALGGGFAGCFLLEKVHGASGKDASRAAMGATLGRFGGFVVKLGIGIGIIWLSAPRIWGGV
jgi:uncharacterized protein YqgC (DUF456 family)